MERLVFRYAPPANESLMITELAEIIVQRETKLRGADMKVMRAWGPVTHGDIGDTFEIQ